MDQFSNKSTRWISNYS